MVTGCRYPASRKIGVPDVFVTPGYVSGCVVQVIVCDAKVIAETLTISDAMQGFPDVVVSPLFIIVCGDWINDPPCLIRQNYYLFKHLLTTHNMTLVNP